MTDDATISTILRAYDERVEIYKAFTEKVFHLCRELVAENSLTPHSITYRVKARQSIEAKLKRTDANYKGLSEVTDISGLRITTYFHDEVDNLASYLENEFEVLQEHSVDKRKSLDADRFGYLSVHYVARLSDDRLKLTEYRRFKDFTCEIQVRSILQHAWAEIEHDLGYKTSVAVPRMLRRRFSRLAGLLELADEEFVAIRNELNTYREQLPNDIKNDPAIVTLDKLSLVEFLRSNGTASGLDEQIAGIFGAKITDTEASIEHDLRILSFFGIGTVSELEGSLKQNHDLILAFAKIWIKTTESTIVRGICLLYFAYLLLAQSGESAYAVRFLNELNIGRNADEVASKIFLTYAAVQKAFAERP